MRIQFRCLLGIRSCTCVVGTLEDTNDRFTILTSYSIFMLCQSREGKERKSVGMKGRLMYITSSMRAALSFLVSSFVGLGVLYSAKTRTAGVIRLFLEERERGKKPDR